MNGFLSLPTWSPYIVGVGIGLLICLALCIVRQADRLFHCIRQGIRTYREDGSWEEGAGERILQEISPTHRLAVHDCARDCYRCIHILLPFRHIRFLHRSATLGCTVRRLQQYSGSSQPLPGESSSVLGQGGQAVAQAGMDISGSLQLSVGSILSAACFFVGGIAMAMILFGIPL